MFANMKANAARKASSSGVVRPLGIVSAIEPMQPRWSHPSPQEEPQTGLRARACAVLVSDDSVATKQLLEARSKAWREAGYTVIRICRWPNETFARFEQRLVGELCWLVMRDAQVVQAALVLSRLGEPAARREHVVTTLSTAVGLLAERAELRLYVTGELMHDVSVRLELARTAARALEDTQVRFGIVDDIGQTTWHTAERP